MALYFAAGRWGNGTGIYDYRAEADRLLDNIKNRPVIAGQTVKEVPRPMVRSSTPNTRWYASLPIISGPMPHRPLLPFAGVL